MLCLGRSFVCVCACPELRRCTLSTDTFLGGKVFGRDRATRRGMGAGARTDDRSEVKEEMHAAQRWAGVVQKHPVLATTASCPASRSSDRQRMAAISPRRIPQSMARTIGTKFV